jgi:hypothetical protein
MSVYRYVANDIGSCLQVSDAISLSISPPSAYGSTKPSNLLNTPRMHDPAARTPSDELHLVGFVMKRVN